MLIIGAFFSFSFLKASSHKHCLESPIKENTLENKGAIWKEQAYYFLLGWSRTRVNKEQLQAQYKNLGQAILRLA